MTEIHDSKLIEKYMKKYKFSDMFSTEDLPFQLCRYEVGEMMNIPHSQEKYLKFLVQGRVAVDKVDQEGKLHRLFEESAFDFFGEAEICGHKFNDHYHEVVETAYCIELPMEPYRKILWNDLKFMQFMVSRMSESVYIATAIMEDLRDDAEARLLSYIRNYCENNTFSGMELTAKRVRCSSRQFYRVVGKLVNEGRLVKTGWGIYTLV